MRAEDSIPIHYRLIKKAIPYLGWGELFLLAGLATGMLVVFILESDGKLITELSLLGLAVIYFLKGYQHIQIPHDDAEALGFKDLLALVIIPKVVYISCAISAFGIYLLVNGVEHQGDKYMMMIGGSTLLVAHTIIAYAFVTGTKRLKYLLPTLARATPLMLVDIYIFFR
jgi:hypothetical protein